VLKVCDFCGNQVERVWIVDVSVVVLYLSSSSDVPVNVSSLSVVIVLIRCAAVGCTWASTVFICNDRRLWMTPAPCSETLHPTCLIFYATVSLSYPVSVINSLAIKHRLRNELNCVLSGTLNLAQLNSTLEALQQDLLFLHPSLSWMLLEWTLPWRPAGDRRPCSDTAKLG